MTTASVHATHATHVGRTRRAARTPQVLRSVMAAGSLIARSFRAAQELDRAATNRQRMAVAETFIAGRTI